MGATPEIFGRLVVDQPVSAQQELSLPKWPEQRLRDVAPQELPVARERSGSRRVLPDAMTRQASGQPPEELRQVVAQWTARREQPLDAAAEQHSDGQCREQPRFRPKARRQQASVRQRA